MRPDENVMTLFVKKKSFEKIHLQEVQVRENKLLAENQWGLWLEAKEKLPAFCPGQFCMLSCSEEKDPLLPRPFAIVEHSGKKYFFIYRVTGKFTHTLSQLKGGGKLKLLGPLGRGFSPQPFSKKRHVFIAGGVGLASLLPLMNCCTSQKTLFYGVKTKKEVLTSVLPRGSKLSSDDGSIGFKGKIPELLKTEKDQWQSADFIYVCGPTGMMKAVYDLLPPQKTFYFLEETMGCGIGICVGCVVPLQKKEGGIHYVHSCLKGPIFRGDELRKWKKS